MNIPQIPDIEEIKRKMAEANMNFPEPVSYPDQLQSIRDLPPMTQMPTREEIQMAMQNIPVPEKAFTPAQTIQEKIQMAMQNIPVHLDTSPKRKNTSGNAKYACTSKKHQHQPKQFKKKYKRQCKICQRLYQNQWSFPAFRSFLLQYHKCPQEKKYKWQSKIFLHQHQYLHQPKQFKKKYKR
jgi:hypothetical protein